MIEINRSLPSEDAQRMRKSFEDKGYIEAKDEEEATRLEAEGEMVFIDHTNNGADSFSAEEMADFRRTPFEEFEEHQKRWGR